MSRVTLSSLRPQSSTKTIVLRSHPVRTPVSSKVCDGGHGLSTGSIGGKSNNDVSTSSLQTPSLRNPKIGPISKPTLERPVSNISIYGIDVQQDCLNRGTTGTPTNGVSISWVTMSNITGTVSSSARNYYILCGSGSWRTERQLQPPPLRAISSAPRMSVCIHGTEAAPFCTRPNSTALHSTNARQAHQNVARAVVSLVNMIREALEGSIFRKPRMQPTGPAIDFSIALRYKCSFTAADLWFGLPPACKGEAEQV
ncbi:hypothetical protein B0H19DRAFT_1063360 [Mycena capillaripes]|nr:hypothetical protein B0H19DRAFT_1063360 [Mycena capillaripes]